jgi:transcriptional regulator
MTEKFEKEISEKLDIIIKLLSQMSLGADTSQTGRILQLNSIGIKPSQIAQTLNTTQNYVNMILSKKRKENKKQDEKTKTE